MGQVGSKMRRVGGRDGYTAGGLAHWCPGCAEMHAFALDGKNSNGAQWTWNGVVENPTFSPSMHITATDPDTGEVEVCHYFLTNGVLQYLADCTHGLRNQRVILPELPSHLRDRARTSDGDV